jgi:hypothetical protein
MEAIVSTRAFESAPAKGAQIRTGGWFNFSDDADASSSASSL